VRRSLLVLALLLAYAGPGNAYEDAEPAYGRTPTEMKPYGKWDSPPYRILFTTAPQYRGSGREDPEPEGLKTVRIGLFAPLEGTTDDAEAGRAMRDGISLALEETNAAGGYKGIPFELVVKNDQFLWGTASKVNVDLAYRDKVWAVIGSMDSDSTHIAIRTALKTHLPFINVGANSPDITETNIPWVIRCNPDDRQTSYLLVRHIFDEKKLSRVAVLRSADRYGRTGIIEFRDAARRLGHPLPLEILFKLDAEDFSSQLERIQASDAQVVVLWAKARSAGRILKQLRARGMKQPVFATDRIVTPAFLAAAGEAAEGVTATYWMNPESAGPRWTGFQERFRARFDREADAFSAYAFDAARLLLEAIGRAGLNRVRIRDELFAFRSYSGVSGSMTFDKTQNNVASPVLAHVEHGHFVFH